MTSAPRRPQLPDLGARPYRARCHDCGVEFSPRSTYLAVFDDPNSRLRLLRNVHQVVDGCPARSLTLYIEEAA